LEINPYRAPESLASSVPSSSTLGQTEGPRRGPTFRGLLVSGGYVLGALLTWSTTMAALHQGRVDHVHLGCFVAGTLLWELAALGHRGLRGLLIAMFLPLGCAIAVGGRALGHW